MFRLVRYFSITSLIAFIVMTAVLGYLYRQQAVVDLVKVGESKNVALTQTFANSLWPQFEPYVVSSAGLSVEELKASPEISQLRQSVLGHMSGLTVVKVKVYNLQGITVFSTEEKQIGEDESQNAGFISAANGTAATELTHRDTFSAFEKTISDRDLVSSYVPIVQAGSVVGVFEVYDDVTPLLRQIDESVTQLLVVVVAVLATLYFILLAIVLRAASVIRRQQQEIVHSQAELNAVLNSVGEAIITVDPTGAIVKANQETLAIWGYRMEDLTTHSLGMLLDERGWDVLFARIKRYLETEDPDEFGDRVRIEGRRKSGASIPLEGRIVETRIGENLLLFTIALRELGKADRLEIASA
jgi:PAS domain S-box-containing protein